MTFRIALEKNIKTTKIKNDYRLQEYLKIVRNPADRISITKLRLGVHT